MLISDNSASGSLSDQVKGRLFLFALMDLCLVEISASLIPGKENIAVDLVKFVRIKSF